MNKAEFIEFVAEKLQASKVDTEKSINAVLEGIEELLAKGEAITFVGFGTFKVSERAARIGRNPRTGEALNIPAMTMPVFKAGKALKDAVSKNS
ncbi:MAG: DNA-binding protein [Gammaproteobacteria bacterium RIFCSPHIGHO2_12_FULL_35_23]|nr:MAG: DNA-binding protein [Gammaproteobacteria bacterium RIFCSPHIGHO2_12_FULL_35_23]